MALPFVSVEYPHPSSTVRMIGLGRFSIARQNTGTERWEAILCVTSSAGPGNGRGSLPLRSGRVPAGAGDGIPFVVEQALDLQHGFDVLAAVEPVALGTFHRLEHREFGLPIPQHEGLGGGQPAHLADAEKALLGDLGSALAVAWHRG